MGPNHHDVAISLNNLALIYRTQGNNARATPLYQRALAITEQILGSENPGIIEILYNLAELQHVQGDIAGAIDLRTPCCEH